MERARRAAVAALFVVIVIASAVAAAPPPASPGLSPAVAAAVAWPTSTLVVSEVVTGGASASDEFVEIANAGAATVDLATLEVVYVTSTGSTVTRKATWTTPRPLEPGRHLLLANSSGVFAPLADATYSGGLAATGGAIVIRPVGGTPIDAVGWGDAANAFVEGTPSVAAPAGSSIERLPGGGAGNGTDTNDNRTDWFVQPGPTPQNLASPAVLPPTPSPSAVPTTPAPPSASPVPTPTPSSPEPTAAPTGSPV